MENFSNNESETQVRESLITTFLTFFRLDEMKELMSDITLKNILQ